MAWCCFVLSGEAQTLSLPPRAPDAPAGSALAQRLAPLGLAEREQAVFAEVLAGNVPPFLRRLCPVEVAQVTAGRTNRATYWATADYLAVGSDADYLLMPLSPNTAQRIADALGCVLPTRKMVDDIYAASAVKLAPAPIAPSPAMTTVVVFSNHNAIVHEQRSAQLAAHPLGALVAGHKKDVVISAKLAAAPGKVAIYGWHQLTGAPIQPLYLGHTAAWVDYSQCTRLVQQRVVVNGQTQNLAQVVADATLAPLLSDEGLITQPRYSTNPPPQVAVPAVAAAATTNRSTGFTAFRPSPYFHERITSFDLEPSVKVHVNAPGPDSLGANHTVLLIFYALPNGNTTAQTIGKQLAPGDDWHFDIQHIGAQTRFLRGVLTNRCVVVAYVENALKSWPAWRKQHGDAAIPPILAHVQRIFAGRPVETVLAGHSGGGSLLFGYLNTVERIPDEVVRIAFLDSNYAYDRTLGHEAKLAAWLNADEHHQLCVLAYNDAVALLEGKPFVSAAGGTWGKSHEMQRDLAADFQFRCRTNAGFETYSALGGRLQFLLKENPEQKIFHTVQVERNGFIHSMLTGTPNESRGYEYFGPRAYTNQVQPAAPE